MGCTGRVVGLESSGLECPDGVGRRVFVLEVYVCLARSVVRPLALLYLLLLGRPFQLAHILEYILMLFPSLYTGYQQLSNQFCLVIA